MNYIYYLIVALFLNCFFVYGQDNSTKPNIIIVLTDDMGYNDVGFNGCKDIPTPNIDRIAMNGVKFTNGYVSYAVCGPSRAGLITGRYQDRFGFSRNPLFAPNDIDQGLPLTEETMATVLGREDYKSIAIGKWHLGGHEKLRPLNRGFTEFFGFLTGGHHYLPEKLILNDLSELTNQYAAYKTKLLKNNTRVEEKEYLTDALSREAVDFIKRNKDEPFFIYLAYNAPHTPLEATDKYLSRFEHIKEKKRKTYAAMVSAVDDGVGNILNTLDELNLNENTLVFFLSDNGGPEPHNASDNGKLREGKSSLYEGGIRVPFALQWPGTIPKGQVYNNPIISLDIFATASALANAKPKNKLDGVNLIPYLTKSTNNQPHEVLFWRKFDDKWEAVRKGDYKFIRKQNMEDEVYNVALDMGETTPIKEWATEIEIPFEMILKKWQSMLLPPVFLGLKHGRAYNKKHPNRFIIKKY